MTISNEDLTYFIGKLKHRDPRERVITLRTLRDDPIREPGILAALETLTHDNTLAVLTLPYRFGEIRCLAAQVLSASVKFPTTIVIPQTFYPMSTTDIVQLADQHGIDHRRGGIEGVIELLGKLRDAGHLDLIDYTINP